MLSFEVDLWGNRRVLNPTLVWDSSGAVLIDTGMPGMWRQIRAAMVEAGVQPEQLRAVVLTHQDIDHIGSLLEIMDDFNGQLAVYAHAADQPYIEGDVPLMKMDEKRRELWFARLTEEEKQVAERVLQQVPRVRLTGTLADGQILPLAGGLQTIFTPGHTPGHICIYLPTTRTLVAGDATVSENGRLLGPNPQATPDLEQAWQSLRQFLRYPIERVICYHGGLCDQDVQGQLQSLIQRPSSL
ncbi:MAG: MBL fold metallo-hydrolase [Alicyclobacillus sp.]|nr:MBL fold metallo-hydrolase [Alicyclobacillus sp.]